MLKIQRSDNGLVFTLSGRIETEDIEELQQLLALETAGQQLVLDLRNVTLVNQDVVTFLASCEAGSIAIRSKIALPIYESGSSEEKLEQGAGELDESI